MNNFAIQDHVAIITGSAQGFGKEFAIRLLEAGSKVCISDVNPELGRTTTNELKELFGDEKVTFKECDVTNKDDWEALWNHAERYFGNQITLLINNAGIGPEYGWKKCLDVMLIGTSYGTFLALEKMSIANDKKGGRIINIASMAGLLEGGRNIEESGYFMAKFGTVALTRGFAQRGREGPWRKHGVKAMALCPWFANTQLVRKTTTVGELETTFNRKAGRIPLKMRVMTAEEVGDKLTEVLKLDKSGACYVVFPDCPLVDFPNLNSYWVYSMIMFGQWFATPLGMKSFGMTVFIAFFLLIMVVIFLLFLSILF